MCTEKNTEQKIVKSLALLQEAFSSIKMNPEITIEGEKDKITSEMS